MSENSTDATMECMNAQGGLCIVAAIYVDDPSTENFNMLKDMVFNLKQTVDKVIFIAQVEAGLEELL